MFLLYSPVRDDESPSESFSISCSVRHDLGCVGEVLWSAVYVTSHVRFDWRFDSKFIICTSIIYSTLATNCPQTLTKGISNPAAMQLAITRTHYPVPSGRSARSIQHAPNAKASPKKKGKGTERKKTNEKKKSGEISRADTSAVNQHHITTQPLPSFFFFPTIHCTSLLFSF